MQVWAQGCPTLYKSQVVLSIKDTPSVPKLCIKSEHDRVFDGAPVVLLPATHLLEPAGRIERASRCVRLADLEVDLPDTARGQCLENASYERTSQAVTPPPGSHGEIQDLALVGGVERDDVASDLPPRSRLDDKKKRIGRHAVAKILCGPRIGKDLLLDRVDRGDIAELSGANLEGVGRGAPPISLVLPQDVHRSVRRSLDNPRVGPAPTAIRQRPAAPLPQEGDGRSNPQSLARIVAHRRRRLGPSVRGRRQRRYRQFAGPAAPPELA